MSFSTARLGWSEPIPAKPALACSANLRSQINQQSARGFGAGITESDDLPVAPQTHRGGQPHAFWMKLDQSGQRLLFSTYYGVNSAGSIAHLSSEGNYRQARYCPPAQRNARMGNR